MSDVSERTRVAGKLLEEYIAAPPTFSTRWDYVSRGPYRIQRRYSTDPIGEVTYWDTVGDIVFACGLFCEVALPMQRETICVLMDETFRVVLGYSTEYGGIAGVGMGWWGTAETFGLLEDWSGIEPMELAVWESIARRYVT